MLQLYIFFQFLVSKTLDSELDSDPYPDPQLGKMLDQDPDPHKINADPQPWSFGSGDGLIRITDYLGYMLAQINL